MFKVIALYLTLPTLLFANNCDELYNSRGESLKVTQDAFNCLDILQEESKLFNSKRLNKMAHLKFFEATYFENDRLNSLVKSYSLAKKSINQYAVLFNSTELKKLPSDEIDEVALSYYFYGTSVSKYVDLKGKWEAIKRMSEIKNSMNMILRLKRSSTYHYGAYRNLAIFNLKVPKIAGGKITRSKLFFEKLIKESSSEIGVSTYPVGHIYYAEYLKRVGKKAEACKQLTLVKDLTDAQINSTFLDLIYETKKDRSDAEKVFEKYSC